MSILKLALSFSKRKKIIKLSYRNITKSISEGTRDEELIEESKVYQYTASGLATSFDNEATKKALEEIIAKDLARIDEKTWFTDPISRIQIGKEGEILTEAVAIRSKHLGIKLIN